MFQIISRVSTFFWGVAIYVKQKLQRFPQKHPAETATQHHVEKEEGTGDEVVQEGSWSYRRISFCLTDWVRARPTILCMPWCVRKSCLFMFHTNVFAQMHPYNSPFARVQCILWRLWLHVFLPRSRLLYDVFLFHVIVTSLTHTAHTWFCFLVSCWHFMIHLQQATQTPSNGPNVSDQKLNSMQGAGFIIVRQHPPGKAYRCCHEKTHRMQKLDKDPALLHLRGHHAP